MEHGSVVELCDANRFSGRHPVPKKRARALTESGAHRYRNWRRPAPASCSLSCRHFNAVEASRVTREVGPGADVPGGSLEEAEGRPRNSPMGHARPGPTAERHPGRLKIRCG